MGWPAKFARLWADAGQAHAQCGRTRLAQVMDLLNLALSPARLGPGDYYSYRLFESGLSAKQKQEFVGWRRESVLDALNKPDWHCLGLDKVLMAALMAEQGLACPVTRAIYLKGRIRRIGQAQALRSDAELQGWLRDPTHYPFFGKPSASGFGRGAVFAQSYDAANDVVRLRSGAGIAVVEFSEHRHDREQLGYLFQTPLTTDPRLQPALGELPTSLRMMVLYDEVEGPLVHRVFWKLPVGHNMNDNFNDGVTGNLAAGLDVESGRIIRVVNGSGLRLREVRQHPDTGVDLLTLAVPDWTHVQTFVKQLALLFPQLRFQQWDIALTSQGPVALELNLFGTGGCELSQVLERRGLVDATMQRFLRRHGLLH